MSEQRLIETINFLLFFASACLFHGITELVTDNEVAYKARPSKHENWTYCVPRPEIHNRVLEQILDTNLTEYTTLTVIETEYIGTYFVTAYASAELGGSTATASGAECHYHEEWNIPTTCAIDRNYHEFGEYLMIDGKVYVTEDTGSGVKGLWVDCYVPDMESVWSWETGYKSVYSVNFTTKQIKTKEVKLNDYYNPYLHIDGFCDWYLCRYGSRVDS